MRSLFFIIALLATASANASTMLLWSCHLLEGHTIEEVKAKNSAWVKAVNELSEYTVQSYVLESIASPDLTAFIYIDVFENPVHWGKFDQRWKTVRWMTSIRNSTSPPNAKKSLYEASES